QLGVNLGDRRRAVTQDGTGYVEAVLSAEFGCFGVAELMGMPMRDEFLARPCSVGGPDRPSDCVSILTRYVLLSRRPFGFPSSTVLLAWLDLCLTVSSQFGTVGLKGLAWREQVGTQICL